MKLHAVVVGVDRYRDTAIRPLRWARADAEALAQLIDSGIHPAQRDVLVLTDEQATKRAIMAAVGDRLARVGQANDLVLLYFACHGSPEIGRAATVPSRHLVVHDTFADELFATGIELETEFASMLHRITDPRWVLVVIDACFSGAAGGRTFEGPALRRSRSSMRGAPLPISLVDLSLGEGRIVVTACDDNQVARESQALGHGIFTHHFLEGLRRTRPTSTVSILQLHDEVRTAVIGASAGKQRPVLNGRDAGLALPSFA